ncbi:MAG: muconate/chloromuconate family cycloisomerase [Anaerolineae bacterium]|nr:MAG: muconate/chloromuconate family cycloisomerase [Anaerolineae bacterium]
MKITGVTTIPIAIPIFRTHKIASFTLNAGYFVLVELETDEGLVGYGEASLSMGPVFPEETWQGALSLVDDYLAPHLIGKNPFNIEAIVREMDQAATRNFTAKFAIETALHDLVGKALDRPAYDLLGGADRAEIPLSWSLASGDPQQEVQEAMEWVEQGHRIFKIKFGFLGPEEDIARLKAIREAVGGDVDLRIDVNQGWTPEIAIPTIRRIEHLALRPTFVEQPVAGWDLKGLARITRSVDTPIMADEGLFTLQDAQAIIELEAADIFAIKVMKHGGILRSKQIAALAEAANIPCYLGSNLETGVATLACLHFAVSTPGVSYGCELFGPKLLVDDILVEPVEYGPGVVRCPARPGTGAVLDQDKVDKYRLR